MSEYSSLKATINANVKANNNQEITGAIMNSVLNAMVTSLGAGYQFIGVATPTNPGSAQTPDYKCFYLATTPGTYTNLGGLVVADGEVAILKYDTSWTKEVSGIASADKLNQLGQQVIYDVSANNGGTTFASLSALLSNENLSTLIPIAVRCGGMSIRFVQTSDNKYVQYRYMGTAVTGNPNPFLDTANWQGVDEEPTAGSDNLVKSGGVANMYGRYVENEEYISILADKYNKIIAFRDKNGILHECVGIESPTINNKVNKETGKSLINSRFSNSIGYIEYEDCLKIETDKYNRIIAFRDKNGILHECVGIESPTIDEIWKTIGNTNLPRIVCWGDSLTAGAGSNDLNLWSTFCANLVSKGYQNYSARTQTSYVQMLQLLTTQTNRVLGCGVGGENIITISSRVGSELAYIPSDIVLPSSAGQKVTVLSGSDIGLPSQYRNVAKLLIQGQGNSVNPVFVQGIKCTLSADVANGQVSAYYLERVSAGDRNVTIPAGTSIITSGSKINTDCDIAILWCWQNGGYTDDNDLVAQLQNMIAHIGTGKYIIIGLHTGTAASRAEQEALLEKTFGDKFFNWRKYVSSNAMYDFGLTPTENDLAAMAVGSIPPSLLHDNVHLTAVSYSILAIKLLERMNIIGYIK